MICLICGKIFFIHRTLKTLFTQEVKFICPSCEKKHPPFIQTQVIPKLGGLFTITSFFMEETEILVEIFYKEVISWLLNSIEVNNKDNYLLWLDKLDLNLLQILEPVEGNIHILTKTIFHI